MSEAPASDFPTRRELSCPSSRPEIRGAALFGVVGGSVEEPRVTYLPKPLPASAEVLNLVGDVAPTEVFRFVGPCVGDACSNFESGRCQLASRIIRLLPIVTSDLPECSIRPQCRWWAEEGVAACMRCPQVATDSFAGPTAVFRTSPDEDQRLGQEWPAQSDNRAHATFETTPDSIDGRREGDDRGAEDARQRFS